MRERNGHQQLSLAIYLDNLGKHRRLWRFYATSRFGETPQRREGTFQRVG